MKEASVLVVIGYSMPAFNRHVDREILAGATQLTRVYIQDPSEDMAEAVKETLLAPLPEGFRDGVQIRTIRSGDALSLPPEL